MTYHIVFKKEETDLQCWGVNITAKTAREALRQQEIDFKDSIFQLMYLTDCNYSKDIYSKQVERWNAQVDIDSLIIEN